jgi:hypothetical protein
VASRSLGNFSVSEPAFDGSAVVCRAFQPRMKAWDHVLENGEVVTLPFIDSPQTSLYRVVFIKTGTLHGELRDW